MDEVVVGTYEGFLLGYSVSENNADKLEQTFATQSHTGSVRCVSLAGKFLASGGTDDKVVVIDLHTRKEHTVLMNHDGTVNAVTFTHSGSHLITGGDDGTIIITRTGNWKVEKIWKKAHGGQPVYDIAVHPSDKLALSIGKDKTLRTWNLIKGRPAFTINLSSKGISMPTEIKFSPGGDRFSLISQQNVDVWTISKAGMEKRITCNSKPSTVQWINDEKILIGLDNGSIISLLVLDTKAETYSGHKQRVKCLYFENNMLYSASSSGEIKLWSVTDSKLTEICSTNANCRLTCITLNRQNHLVKKENMSDNTNVEDNNEEIKSGSASECSVSDVEDNQNHTSLKRKPKAFVTVTYDTKEDNPEGPPQKKAKRKKKNRNKKLKHKSE